MRERVLDANWFSVELQTEHAVNSSRFHHDRTSAEFFVLMEMNSACSHCITKLELNADDACLFIGFYTNSMR